MAKVEEYQQMMAWLTRPKSKFQEPRIMDQAALVDDLEPGPLKDEMLKDFDPSQETYEEYLQRKNLERPFNMNQGGQVVIGKPGGLVQPETKFYAIKKTIKGTGKNAGNVTTYVGPRGNQTMYIGSQDYIDKIRKDNPRFGLVGKTVNQKKADRGAANKKAIKKNFKDTLGIDVEISKKNLITGKGLTEELKKKIASAQSQYRKKNPGQAGLTNEGFWEFYSNKEKNKEAAATAAAEKEAAKMKAKSPDFIKELDRPLTKGERMILNKSYDNIFLEEFDRLKNEGDLFSKTDLNRAVINRIADENPTIDLESGKGLDKVFNGDENHKSMHERTDGGRTSLLTKKDMQNFTTNTNALGYTKNQDRLLQALLRGNTDFDDLAEELGFNEGRLKGNVNKLMRNLAQTEKSRQPLFFRKYSDKELEKARQAVYESPTLESAYQRTALQSILSSTLDGSKQRKDAINKLKEFNKFKKVMEDNGLSGKLVSLDHAASYRAIKNGNIKNFLAMTPIMSDINAVKSTFDRRSQLNLRRMQDAINSGDNASYKKFLKNQTELEGIWKTMTGDQSTLGKIRIGATGKKKGVTKIFDYGATSILDKNKNLLNELSDNLVIRENIVKASTKGNLDEVSRIMFEGSAAEKPRPSMLPESFRRLNKPEMFKAEKQIKKLLTSLCPKGQASGGRIGFATGTPTVECGVNELSKQLANGPDKAKVPLIRKILAGGANLLKQALNPKELLKIENLIGKPALYAAAALETGLVADDVLRKGKPLNVAAAESLFGSVLNLDADAARAKNLLESGAQLSPAAQEYAQNILDYDKYRKLNLSFPSSLVAKSMPGSDKYFKMQEDLKNKIESTPDTGAMDYMSALDESEGTFKAKPKYFPGTSLEMDSPDAPEVTPLTNKFAKAPGRRVGPMTAKQDMQIDFSLPTYDRSFTASDDFLNQYLKSIGEEPLQPGEGTWFRMNEPDQRGLFGTQERFAGGGIASIRRPHAIPPKSGPNPQGLPSMLNRVKRI
jgi:hypothetical protein